MNQPLKKILHFPITKILLGISSCLAVLILVQNFISKPIFQALIATKQISDTFVNYTSIAVLLATYYFLFNFLEQRNITEITIRNHTKELFGGFILGFGILSLVILILYALGYYQITNFNGYSYFLAPLSSLVISALLEEIMFRAILYRILENWLGTYIALAIISVSFELPHVFNDNVTFLSIVLGLIFGFAHGIMYTYTKRIWLPFAFHLAWNFAQPFYGSNLSGIEDVGNIFSSTFNGPKLLTGSIYGLEDSILSIILLSIVSIIFLYASIQQGKIVPPSFKKQLKQQG